MTMKIEDPETGEEVEVYTKDEFDTQNTALKEAGEALTASQEALEKAGKVSAQKTENFKRLNEMTEDERAALKANEVSLFKQNEMLEDKLNTMESKLDEDAKTSLQGKKDALLKKYHNGDEDSKKLLEQNWDLVSLEGVDNDTLAKRAELAASMSKISIENISPLNASIEGSAPNLTQVKEGEQKVEQGMEALRVAGLLPAKEKPNE